MTERRGPITIHAARRVFDNPWLGLTEHDVSIDSGRAFSYTVVNFKRLATGVVPLHDDGTVTLVGQHRFPLDIYSWEIPEGGSDPGEDPLDTAKREMAEEALLAGDSWTKILTMHLSNSVTDEVAHVYLATGLSPAEGERDDTEDLALNRVPFSQALAMCADGRITDAITVAALFRVFHMAASGELSPETARLIMGPG